MKIRDGLDIDGERLADICRRWHITELSLFGSVFRDDFGPESDIDLLYEFEAGHGRPVDLVPKRFLSLALADVVVRQAEPLYAA